MQLMCAAVGLSTCHDSACSSTVAKHEVKVYDRVNISEPSYTSAITVCWYFQDNKMVHMALHSL